MKKKIYAVADFKYHRVTAMLTIDSLAEKSGVSASMIRQLENRNVSCSDRLAINICGIMKKQFNDLFELRRDADEARN